MSKTKQNVIIISAMILLLIIVGICISNIVTGINNAREASKNANEAVNSYAESSKNFNNKIDELLGD